jgi:hypothetical protein
MRLFVASVVVLSLAAPARADTKADVARIEIRTLTVAAETYKLKRGNYPEKLADLKAAGYVEPKATLTDPWGKRYQYDPKGKRNGGNKPDVWTEDPDKNEIGNWQAEKK